jgi:uncharacterized protein YcgI (DUF1989 family)
MIKPGPLVTDVLIPARHGRALTLREGQRLKVIAVRGKQICDFWAFDLTDPTEFLSMSYTRSSLRHLKIQVGKPLYNNKRRPILILEEDTVGVHDMFVAACDPLRYLELGAPPDHRSCKMNALEALASFSVHPPVFPDPLNLFQNTLADEKGALMYGESRAKAGDYVLFRALQPLLVVGSACPFDLNPAETTERSEIRFEAYDDQGR